MQVHETRGYSVHKISNVATFLERMCVGIKIEDSVVSGEDSILYKDSFRIGITCVFNVGTEIKMYASLLIAS